jgi:hypothetical protein
MDNGENAYKLLKLLHLLAEMRANGSFLLSFSTFADLL